MNQNETVATVELDDIMVSSDDMGLAPSDNGLDATEEACVRHHSADAAARYQPEPEPEAAARSEDDDDDDVDDEPAARPGPRYDDGQLVLIEELLLMAGLETQKRFLPDRVKHARPANGEQDSAFARRVSRLHWQLAILNRLTADDVDTGNVFAEFQRIAAFDFGQPFRDDPNPNVYQDTNNNARLAFATLIQAVFRAAVSTVLFHERLAKDREQEQLRARRCMDEFNMGVSSMDDDMRPVEGATTAQPGRDALVDDSDLTYEARLRKLPLGDKIAALDVLFNRLSIFRIGVESRIEGWGNYTPRPLSYYSVRNEDTGEFEEAVDYPMARELESRAADSKVKTNQNATKLFEAAMRALDRS